MTSTERQSLTLGQLHFLIPDHLEMDQIKFHLVAVLLSMWLQIKLITQVNLAQQLANNIRLT
jgi:hypothetical protein